MQVKQEKIEDLLRPEQIKKEKFDENDESTRVKEEKKTVDDRTTDGKSKSEPLEEHATISTDGKPKNAAVFETITDDTGISSIYNGSRNFLLGYFMKMITVVQINKLPVRRKSVLKI